MSIAYLRQMPQLEVAVDSVVILGEKAIVNLRSLNNHPYSIKMTKKKSEKFEFNEKYTAFMDYKMDYSTNQKCSKMKYGEAMNVICSMGYSIHSVRKGNSKFIYP